MIKKERKKEMVKDPLSELFLGEPKLVVLYHCCKASSVVSVVTCLS